MKTLKRFIFLILFCCSVKVSSQSSCTNSDFETGTLSGWQGGIGQCCPVFTSPSGIINGRHTIMTGNGTDPNTCNVVHVVSPGGTYSARLGNDNVNSEAETLSYAVTVTPSSSLFIYKYAVVLQDPGHASFDQPRFGVRVLDASGALIDPVCGQYNVVAGVGLAGFQTCPNWDGDIRYRDWTTVGLNLSAYMGQTITVEFQTADCGQGAHFGYAYVDAYCSPLQIAASFCSGSFAAQLVAPIGFSYLWNTGETTQSIIVTNPNAGLNYTCTMTSVTGCVVSISTILQLEDPSADFDITNTCFNNAVFSNTTLVSNPTLLDTFLWNFGDGTTSTDQNPTHSFPGTGTYSITFSISNAFGCSTTTTQSVTVFSAPTAQISYPQNSFCTSETTPKAILLTGTDAYTGGTYSATPTGLSLDVITGEFTPSTSLPGNYVVSYTIPPSNNCTVPPVTTSIAIIQAPQATINYSAPSFCNLLTSTQFVNLTGIGTISGGVYTVSPSGLNIDATYGGIRPNMSTPGTYTVTYTILASGGCNVITSTTQVTIIGAPTVSLTYSTPFCTSLTSPQAITLNGTGGFNVGSFSASPTGLQINPATGAIIPSLSIPGNYQVNYTIPAAGGCTSVTANTNVTITLLPTAAISYADPYCRSITTPELVTLVGTSAYTGGVFSAPSEIAINSTTGGITPSSSIAGTYQITYSTPASGGCSNVSATTMVTIHPLPEPSVSNFTICKDPRGHVFRPAIINTGLSDSLYSCQWFLNNSLIPNENNNIITVAAEGSYSVIATNLLTGCVGYPVISVVSTAITVEDFYAYVTNTFTHDNELTVIVEGGTGPYLYNIDNSSFQVSNIFTNLSSGIHSVSITDVNNCTDVTKDVIVLGYPKFFTPNGDGINDYWNIYYFDMHPNALIYIYDRYGKLIKVQGPQSPGWDGTYNGKLLTSTDYWFLVEFKDYNKKGEFVWQTFKSHFSMLR